MYNQTLSLPFRKIYAIDFEYYGDAGEVPKIVCMVVQNVRTGEISRVWLDELGKMKTPPFETEEDIVILTYFAPAEIQSMLALDWSTNVSVIDLFAEFRCETNGNPNIIRF